ncbi:site-specific integrase [Salinicoccus sp. ID82-1]|uniref:tyrosine-type recombinase/integrase n=1 Tax=Salinicoccus sp. ID82-1 TaxID=2820269 RepID=UPI001F46C873|nr:site-specific integrase [Salinicoccus sp. ID82-1]MCG1009267.1 site-specific integrase [Salinicoccus sp. ID82-1]
MKAIKINGKYGYDFRYNGKRYRRQGFSRKVDAEAQIRRIVNEASRGVDATSNVLLVDYYERWMIAKKEGRVVQKTWNNYKNVLNLMEDHFGPTKRLKDLNGIEYQEFINKYAQRHTRETVRKVHNAVNKCLEHAVKDGLIYQNPTWDADIYGKVPPRPEDEKYMEVDEYKALKHHIKNYSSKSALFIFILICTGARFGEVNQLKYKDLNKNQIHLPGTKTETSDRNVDIAEKDMAHIKLVLSQHTINLHDYIFNLSHRAVEKTFKHALRHLNISEDKTLHSLRHTHCSYLLANDVSIYYISQRLGHKNISITTKVYSHLLKDHYVEDNHKTLILLGGM